MSGESKSTKAGVAKGVTSILRWTRSAYRDTPLQQPAAAAGGVILHGLDVAHLSAARAGTTEPSALGGCPSAVPWMRSIAPSPIVPIRH